MSDTIIRTESAEYREGEVIPEAHLRGEETAWEKATRDAAAGIDPTYDDHDKLPGRPLDFREMPPGSRGALGLGGYVDTGSGVEWVRGKRREQPSAPQDRHLVQTPEEGLTIWAEEVKASGETAYSPRGLNNASPLVGDSHEAQVKRHVEGTPGFAAAYDALRRMYVEGTPQADDAQALYVFRPHLAKRFPYRSIPKSDAPELIAMVDSPYPQRRDRLRPGFRHDPKLNPAEEQ